jgi:geranylgeranyl pyrophosphate synthase
MFTGFFSQMQNDYKNVFMPEEYYRKNDISMNFADDLTQGKFSFPLVHAIETMKNEEICGEKFIL